MGIKAIFSFKRYPVTYLSLFFLSLIIILLVFNRFLFAPKILLLCAIIIVAVSLGKLKIMLKDWFVFLSFVYLFDSLRGTIYALTCRLNLPVHTFYVINIEKFLFGEIPSVSLQKLLLKGGENLDFGLLEKSLTAIYGTHFVAFLFVGLVIWIQKPEYFSAFKNAFYWVTIIGVSGYFLIPTVPPWMASRLFGIIPELTHFNLLIFNMTIPDLTSGFSTNPIAAMPSLHAAFPALSFLILCHLYRWRSSVFFLYTLAVCFTIVYSGDHYVVDIIAGAILAILCYHFAFRRKALQVKKNLEKDAIPGKNQSGFLGKNRHLIIGAILLAIGIPLGNANKNKFLNDPNSYDYSAVPKYFDFFRHEDQFQDNYKVQLYFGKYYLARKEYDKALMSFHRAVKLSQNIIEKKSALVKIKQIEHILNRQKQNKSP